jgi:cystathionine gamma-synthase
MAAITAAFSILPWGASVVASHEGYSGVMTLLNQYSQSGRLKVTLVDLSKTQDVIAQLPGADLLWLESPSNPCLDVADLPALISAAKSQKILVMVDNTFATALTQRPLEMGADVVMNSVTKFLAGHSDLLMGSLSTHDSELFTSLSNARKLNGSIAGPFEAWLALRGIRTFPLRFTQSCKSAHELALRLSSQILSMSVPNLLCPHLELFSPLKSLEAVLMPIVSAMPLRSSPMQQASGELSHYGSAAAVGPSKVNLYLRPLFDFR